MALLPPFEYRKLGEFNYHILSDPNEIKSHLLKWSMWEWESDHNKAPDEHWTVAWMSVLPKMDFKLEIIHLNEIHPNADLWSVEQFHTELKERADEREEAVLCGVSIAPLLINRTGFELMDGYTRYILLRRYQQKEVFAYIGTVQE